MLTSSPAKANTSSGTLSSSHSLRSSLPELCARLSFTIRLLSTMPVAGVPAAAAHEDLVYRLQEGMCGPFARRNSGSGCTMLAEDSALCLSHAA